MKLKIKKNNLKVLSKNQQSLNAKQTKEINGGGFFSLFCVLTDVDICTTAWAECAP